MDKKTEDEMDGTGLIYWLVNRDYVGFPEAKGAFVRGAVIRNIVYSGFYSKRRIRPLLWMWALRSER